MKHLSLAGVLLLGACTPSLMLPPHGPGSPPLTTSSPERCQSLDDRSTTWGAVALGAGALAGSTGGLTTVPGESTNVRTGLAIGAVVMAAVAVASGYVGQKAASDFTHEGCAK